MGVDSPSSSPKMTTFLVSECGLPEGEGEKKKETGLLFWEKGEGKVRSVEGGGKREEGEEEKERTVVVFGHETRGVSAEGYMGREEERERWCGICLFGEGGRDGGREERARGGERLEDEDYYREEEVGEVEREVEGEEMGGGCDSLNVGVAASILMYELKRETCRKIALAFKK